MLVRVGLRGFSGWSGGGRYLRSYSSTSGSNGGPVEPLMGQGSPSGTKKSRKKEKSLQSFSRFVQTKYNDQDHWLANDSYSGVRFSPSPSPH